MRLLVVPFLAVACNATLDSSHTSLVDGEEGTELRTTCEEDAFEPNDTVAEAGSLIDGDDLRLSDASPNDFFSIQLGPWEAIDIEAYFDNNQGDIDLVLYSAEGIQFDESRSSYRDSEHIHFVNDSDLARSIVVQVELLGDGSGCQVYDLVTDVTLLEIPEDDEELPGGGVECPADIGNYDQDSAATLSEWDGSAEGALNAEEPEDWYIASVPPGETLVVDVDFEHEAGDIDVQIRSYQGDLLSASASSSDHEQVTWTNDTAGLVYIPVRLYLWDADEDTCSPYILVSHLFAE